MKVCLAPTRVLINPGLGGHAWVYLNWSLGLLENGCDVVWLERVPDDMTPDHALELVAILRARLAALGAPIDIALVAGGAASAPGPRSQQLASHCLSLEEAIEGCALLLDFYYEMEPAVLARFPRTALVDIDPGLLQLWIHERQLRVAEHDLHFTIGETVGTTSARFPDVGRNWIYTPPAVSTRAWGSGGSDPGGSFTTVSTWRERWQVFGGKTLINDKRAAFLEYVNLPSRTWRPLELAIWQGPSGSKARDGAEYDLDGDLVLLRKAGWRVRSASEVAGTPDAYREYIRGSQAEFSCAKPSCTWLQNAWLSDRTLCYLASGRPAVVQHTGKSRLLPDSSGLFRFRNADEAVAAIEAVATDPERHQREARALVEEHFDAAKVAARVLELALS